MHAQLGFEFLTAPFFGALIWEIPIFALLLTARGQRISKEIQEMSNAQSQRMCSNPDISDMLSWSDQFNALYAQASEADFDLKLLTERRHTLFCFIESLCLVYINFPIPEYKASFIRSLVERFEKLAGNWSREEGKKIAREGAQSFPSYQAFCSEREMA